MKITTVTTTLEGAPEELSAYHKQISLSQMPAPTSPSDATVTSTASEDGDDEESPAKFVTTNVARRILRRLPLSREQRIVLLDLYGAHPQKLAASALQKATCYSPRQLAGLMGAFGRRVMHTPGHVAGDNFFDWEWIDGAWHYGLPDSVRSALELEKVVGELTA